MIYHVPGAAPPKLPGSKTLLASLLQRYTEVWVGNHREGGQYLPVLGPNTGDPQNRFVPCFHTAALPQLNSPQRRVSEPIF